jgi:hypothetical protein
MFVKANHKLAHGGFPVLDRHGPAFGDVAQAQIQQIQLKGVNLKGSGLFVLR